MFDSIEDPSDWPASFTELKKIDSLLRCSICFEYFDIAVVVPTCSHNYCSICIRKHVASKSTCPACNKNLEDRDLQPNRIVDELVLNFKTIRKKLLELIQASLDHGISNIKSKQKKHCNTDDVWKVFRDALQEKYSSDSQQESSAFETTITKYRRPPKHKKVTKANTNENLNETRKYTADQIPSSSNNTSVINNSTANDKTVSCPVCGEAVAEGRINIHLDGCLKNKEKRPPKRKCSAGASRVTEHESSSSGSKRRKTIGSDRNDGHTSTVRSSQETSSTQLSQQREAANDLIQSSCPHKRLPKVCLDVLNDEQLRTKAKSFNLTFRGDIKKVKERLQAYILMYNAHCDSIQPFTSEEIARKVEENEKNLKQHGYKPGRVLATHDRRHTQAEKEEFTRKHAHEYSGHYDKLIEEVKNRKTTQVARPQPQESHESDLDSDSTPLFGQDNDDDDEEYVFDIIDMTNNDDNPQPHKRIQTTIETTSTFPKLEPFSPSNSTSENYPLSPSIITDRASNVVCEPMSPPVVNFTTGGALGSSTLLFNNANTKSKDLSIKDKDPISHTPKKISDQGHKSNPRRNNNKQIKTENKSKSNTSSTRGKGKAKTNKSNVKTKGIDSFFRRSKVEPESPNQCPPLPSMTLPCLENQNIGDNEMETILENDSPPLMITMEIPGNNNRTIVPESPKVHCDGEKTLTKTPVFNSTVADYYGSRTNALPPSPNGALQNVSPVREEEDKGEDAQLTALRQKSAFARRGFRYNLPNETVISNYKPAGVQVTEVDSRSNSPSLFDNDGEEQFSGVSAEISFLVDQHVRNAKRNQNQDQDSGSETDVESVADNSIVPRPPSNLDFTECESQRF